MDQFRQIGEVLGSIRALMVLKHDIQINQKQCYLLFDIFNLAFETISEEIRQNLKFHDNNTKWKPLEAPMKELYRIFKEGELYIKTCLEIKNWWGKAISLHQSKDCIEFHIHNLLSCFPLVIEAIELTFQVSGLGEEDMRRRKFVLTRKYDVDLNDQRTFEWKFGRQYLVHCEMRIRIDSAWKEDKWALLETMREKNSQTHTLTKSREEKLAEFLAKKLNGEEMKELLPGSILVGAQDYNVKRRLGSGGSHVKEIQWLGECFALKTFFGEIDEPLKGEILLVLSLSSHPNVLQYLCGFYDKERKEGFLVMELMQKSLFTYMKENSGGQRKRVPFSLPVAVDIMLQIARGMEHLHSRKIYHGDLNPSNILLKARNLSPEGYFRVKVKGFGLTTIKSYARASPRQSDIDPMIWNAPEGSKYTEKADVYSFAMVSFELLTGKVPFEDSHLQGEKTVRNIKAGERPLFPHPFPKFLANLTRKCWQTNPFHRPSFSSICRILRYIKNNLVINPDHGQLESPPPLVDYVDLESGYSKKFPEDGSFDLAPVYQIPFQMFAYKLVEKEKSPDNSREKSSWDSPMDERGVLVDDLLVGTSDRKSVCSKILERENTSLTMADQRSEFSGASQRKTVNTADSRSMSSLTPERKLPLTESAEESPAGFNIQDDKPLSVCLRVSETERCSSSETDSNLQQPSESADTQIGNSITNSSSSKGPKISERKAVLAKETAQNVIQSRIQDKKQVPARKTKDTKPSKLGTISSHLSSPTQVFKDCSSPGSSPARALKGCSFPGSSPARVLKGCSFPGSSPARVFKGCSSPGTSPARVFKDCSSPGASPARVLEGSSSPGSSHIWPPNICSLPRSSPLYPCANCSRMFRETLASTADMSPNAQQRGRLSECNMD